MSNYQQSLRITEIFFSLQGETSTVGLPTVFVRLTGCPLRCQYCDTTYSFHGGTSMTLTEILEQVAGYQAEYITITGGEPLAQASSHLLMEKLCDEGYQVSLETSGALNVAKVDKRVIKIIDIKTPGSGEVERNDWNNLELLSQQDQVKFVICDRKDYEWAKKIILQYQLMSLCHILFSPSYGQLNNQLLADWIIEDRLRVRFQLQMHKYIWGDVPGK